MNAHDFHMPNNSFVFDVQLKLEEHEVCVGSAVVGDESHQQPEVCVCMSHQLMTQCLFLIIYL